MLIKQFTLGHIQTNCYIVTDEKTLECVVIDPGDESNTIMDYLETNKLKCRFILLTHGHFDHTGAVDGVHEQTGALVCMSEKDVKKKITEIGYKFSPPKSTQFLSEGDVITLGALEFDVIETPGHSEGGLTFRCENALFTGDTLFRDSCGRTDLPGSDGKAMMNSLRKLYNLEGDYEVYPGHMEVSSLERERKFNYFMQSATE
ncbi:MAG: MBL fold metallo-hydrolase [Oscillospiraceae bacterium]